MPEILEAYCPECGDLTTHILLRGGSNHVVRCRDCKTIHTITPGRERCCRLRVVVSCGETTRRCTITRRVGEEICTGDEFVVEGVDGEPRIVRVTSIESHERRVRCAEVGEIDTVWARDVSSVLLKISLNLGAVTKPIKYMVPGEKELVIGREERYKNIVYVVNKIKLRDGGFAWRKGRKVFAKDVKRVFASLATNKPRQQRTHPEKSL
ncbi:MAG: HVO_0476 family zinc finger protein [Methanosarcinales archaeon]